MAPEKRGVSDSSFAERLRWQQQLFAVEPDRRGLLSLRASWPLAACRVRVHRNHAVELSTSLARPYLEYAGFDAEWLIGDYDDSLSFPPAEPADADVVWLDFDRFAGRMAPVEVAEWLAARLAVQRSRSPSPILVLDWDGDREHADAFADALTRRTASIGGVRIADRSPLFEQLGDRAFDPDRETLTGTRMSSQAAVQTARLLGSRWLPALLAPRLKAVVVDLDNTLHAGVLGEDGPSGVVLEHGHLELQRLLRELHGSGLFLGLLSRNEPADVDELFRVRSDYPLRMEDFDATAIGWGSKASGLLDIAERLRIDPSAVVFLDDNPGELIQTMQAVPSVRWIHAEPEGSATALALREFPGVFAFERTETDKLRVADLRANADRERMLGSAEQDLGAYYRELGVTLTIGHDRPEELARVAELSGKTNQFNLALSRYSLGDLQALAADGSCQISTVRLQDRLTDSGLIAMAVVRREDDRLLVEELCVSCRALGRRLEDLLIAQMLVSGPLFDGVNEVQISFVDGPRNRPARSWLEGFSDQELPPAAQPLRVTVLASKMKEASANPDVRIEVA